MKAIILSVMLMAFAVTVQANDAKTCQSKTADTAGCCCHKMKTSMKTSTQAKGTCPFAQKASAERMKTSTQAKETCPFAQKACAKQTAARKTTVRHTVLLSPKARDLVW